jgi:hypothetical protein
MKIPGAQAASDLGWHYPKDYRYYPMGEDDKRMLWQPPFDDGLPAHRPFNITPEDYMTKDEPEPFTDKPLERGAMLPDNLLQRAAMANMLGGMPPKPEPQPKGMMALGTQQPMGSVGPQLLPISQAGALPVQTASAEGPKFPDLGGGIPLNHPQQVGQQPLQTMNDQMQPLPTEGGAPMDMIGGDNGGIVRDPNDPRTMWNFDPDNDPKGAMPPASYYPMPWTN